MHVHLDDKINTIHSKASDLCPRKKNSVSKLSPRKQIPVSKFPGTCFLHASILADVVNLTKLNYANDSWSMFPLNTTENKN